MRQIVHIQLGQCGNNIGKDFWHTLAEEHHIDLNGKVEVVNQDRIYNADVLFDPIQTGNYLPRCILVDTQPGTLDSVFSGTLGGLFQPQNFVCGSGSSGNNYARGYHTQGNDLIYSVHEAVRRQAEKCDNIEGFQFLRSVGGGTGSGFGNLVIQHLKDQYSAKFRLDFPVFPSEKVSDTVTQPYNTLLSLNNMINMINMSVIVDNQALYRICTRSRKIKSPTYSNLNQVVVQGLSGVTCGMRFPGQVHSSVRKLATNLIPLPRMHFLTTTLAPVFPSQAEQYRKWTIPELNQQLFDALGCFCDADPRHGRYLTGASVFRGTGISSKEVDEVTLNVYNKSSSYFVEWIPNNVHTSICNVSLKDTPLSGIYMGNSTAISEIFKRVSEQSNAMYRRKAFVHWYTAEGMEEMEFVQAQQKCNDLTSEFQMHQDAVCEEDMDSEDGLWDEY